MFKNFGIDSIMESGKYKGKKIRQILIEDPEYLNWLAIHNEDFYVDPIKRGVDFRSVNSQFCFSKAARTKMDAREGRYAQEIESNRSDVYFDESEWHRAVSEIERERREIEGEYRWAMTDDIPGAGSIDDFG